MRKQKQNTKCHFSANATPFKEQANSFCPQLNLLVGLLPHKEACPICLPMGYLGPGEDAHDVDTHGMEIRGGRSLGF